jgi:5-(carboxyamino)imidazole ribonucleotide synthase
MVAFRAEASFLIARAADGRIAHFPASQNDHKDGILVRSVAPADLPAAVIEAGQNAIQKLATALDVTGLLALETFVTDDHRLLFNELAPRPHNSFHWTIEGCANSQFTQLVRAVAGMPFGNTNCYGQWQMDNLLGEDMTRLDGLPAQAGCIFISMAKPRSNQAEKWVIQTGKSNPPNHTKINMPEGPVVISCQGWSVRMALPDTNH